MASEPQEMWSGSPTKPGPADAADFYIPILVLFLGNFLFFFWCQYKKDNSYIDSLWGLTFVFPALAVFIKRYASD